MNPSQKERANDSSRGSEWHKKANRIVSFIRNQFNPKNPRNDTEWLRSAFDATEDLVFIKDRQSNIAWANQAFRNYHGMSEEDLSDKHNTPHSDRDDTVQYLKDDHYVYTTGNSVDIPSECLTDSNGIAHYFHTIKSPMTDKNGTVTGLIAISRLILSEEEIEHSREERVARKQQLYNLKNFVSSIPLAVAMLDAQMHVLACSETWDALFCPGTHIEPDSSYLELCETILPLQPAYEAALRSGDSKILKGKRFENSAGRKIITNITIEPWSVPTGDVGGALILIEELSPEMQTSFALRNSEEQLSITLNSLGVGVITTDANGRIQRMNAESETITGWTRDRSKNRPIEEVLRLINIDTNRPLISPAKQLKEKMETVHLLDKTGLIHHDGTRKIVALSGSPLHNSFGEMFGLVFVIRDKTKQCLREEESRQSQKMDSIGKLAGGVAHDFNNMLGGIMGAAELLEEELSERQELLKYVKIIFRCSHQASELTDQLLTFARKEKPVFQSISVHECINNVLDRVTRSIDPRINIKQQLSAKNDLITGSNTLLTNAIFNLCINARDAIEEHGIITVETDNIALVEQDAAVAEFGIPPGEYLRLRVTDTGSGIKKDSKDHIFEPFFTTKGSGKGTGLGLSAVYGIIKSHRGGIQVHSERNIGTTFEMFLPLTTQTPSVLENNPATRGRILLIDDEEELQEASAELIRRFGHEVICANNGIQGMKIYHEQADDIDLILLDLVMPGKNGMDCLREIREIKPNAKVIICTGYATEETAHTLHEHGVFRILNKPFRRTDLLAAIQNALQVE